MPHRQLHTELESLQQPISHRHEKRDPKANQQLPQKNCELPEKVGSLDCNRCGATALPCGHGSAARLSRLRLSREFGSQG